MPVCTYLRIMEGVRVFRDRRPRYSLWIQGSPRSDQAHGPSTRYIERIQEEARNLFQGPPVSSKRLDIEIIYSTRGVRPDADNVSKLILDALKGIIYQDDSQIRTAKMVGLRLEVGFRARGFDAVWERLLRGDQFLVNIYDEVEADVYLVDSATPPSEKPSVLVLTI